MNRKAIIWVVGVVVALAGFYYLGTLSPAKLPSRTPQRVTYLASDAETQAELERKLSERGVMFTRYGDRKLESSQGEVRVDIKIPPEAIVIEPKNFKEFAAILKALPRKAGSPKIQLYEAADQ